MRIVFMGTPSYAEVILKRLYAEDGMEVVAVFTQPDKPVGRKKMLTPPAVKVLAQQHNTPIYQPVRLKEAQEELLAIETDFIVVAAYGQILPKAVLEHAPCINLHASILPQYRGASPIQQSLLHGDSESGVTAMRMDEGLDTGDILLIKRFEITPTMLAAELYEALSEMAAQASIEVLTTFDSLQHHPQNSDEATHCTKIVKTDGLVVFDNAEEIYNKYRAFHSWPGVFLENKMKLNGLTLIDSVTPYSAGQILDITKEGVVVGCSKGSICIASVQPASKKMISAKDYLNGKRLDIGHSFI